MHGIEWSTVLIWSISLASILLMLLRPRGIAEYFWIGGGAVLLVLTHLLSLTAALHAVLEGIDVYLFLAGMMVLAELARYEGVFDWVADIAVQHAKKSAARLFFLIYLAGTVVTIFLSNDATAVVLTPAILAAIKKARVEPRPYLLTCAFVANAASFVLPISNPANLVIFGQHLPSLLPWLRTFILPSIVAVAATYFCLRVLERKELAGEVAGNEQAMLLSPGGKITLFGIVLASAVLLTASAFGKPLGTPTFIVGCVALVMVAIRDRQALKPVATGVSWSVLPLVAGLFIIVAALNQAGMLQMTRSGFESLAHMPDGAGKFIAGSAVALLSNIMNNLPVGLVSGTALKQLHLSSTLTNAVLIGVDLGPNLSVTGSLATILWLIALRREGVEITGKDFLKAGVVVMSIPLLLSLLILD